MVKNLKGGKGSKSIGRKYTKDETIITNTNSVRIPDCALELIAVVVKFYGNMCDVATNDKKEYRCFIRGKFRGKFKRSAMISVGKIVLVGLRDFEMPMINCDLLHVYDPADYNKLINIPHIEISSLMNFHNNLSFVGKICEDTFEFSEVAEPSVITEKLVKREIRIIEEDKEINIDDI